MTIVIRSAYNFDRKANSLKNGLHIDPDECRTQQSMKDECDINVIIERFGMGYKMPENFRSPTYGDFSNIGDYHTALNELASAGEAFDTLPALVRDRFKNDVYNLMTFVADESNRDEAIKMGLIPKPVSAPPVVPVTLPPSGASTPPVEPAA